MRQWQFSYMFVTIQAVVRLYLCRIQSHIDNRHIICHLTCVIYYDYYIWKLSSVRDGGLWYRMEIDDCIVKL